MWYCECTNKSRPFTLPNDVLLLQCIRKVFTALHFFPTFCHVTALFQNRLNSLFFTKFYKQYPITTTWMKFVWIFANYKKKLKKGKSIHSLCLDTQNWAPGTLFPLIMLEIFLQLDWSPPVVNSVDWSWFGKAHTCLYKVPQSIMHVRAQTKPWSPRNCL